MNIISDEVLISKTCGEVLQMNSQSKEAAN